MGRKLRILCTGDLHVGRRPSRVFNYADARRCSCAAIFADIIDYAIDQKVDVVAFSGDIVDRENRFYEAYGPVERGIRRLGEAGIDAFAVAGNHDFDVLPKLAENLATERFRLLGRGGAWEQAAVRRDGGVVLNVVGWSFPAEHVHDSPMRTFRLPAGSQVPTLGLLHADLDQPRSIYAPVGLRELQDVPVAMWLLGHVHRPRFHRQQGYPAILNPGSPQAMDPGETGTHGPWMVDLDEGQVVSARHVPMSRVRYDLIDIDLSGIDTKEAFDRHVPQQIRRELEKTCADCGPLEYCCCRLHLVGRTRLHRRLAGLCAALQQDLELQIGACTARVDCVLIETRPPVDLEELARSNDVPGELAKMLLAIRNDQSTEAAALAAQVMEGAGNIYAARAYQPLQDPPPDPQAVRQMLLRQGMLMLDALLSQKEAS